MTSFALGLLDSPSQPKRIDKRISLELLSRNKISQVEDYLADSTLDHFFFTDVERRRSRY